MFALHVADGSELITRRVGGPSLTVDVGNGSERYGSCSARLKPAHLAEGYLPVLQTGYVDAAGVRYHQESFVGRAFGKYGARSVISFVRLVVDARGASHGATVRLVPWRRLAHSAPDRLALGGQTRLIVSDGGEFVQGVVRYTVPAGEQQTIYLEWLNAPSDARYVHANAATYDAARATVVNFWQSRLDTGATFDVPEPAIQNAERGILTQVIANGWRYSIGNPYEELSYAESLDAAEIAAEYGYSSVAKSIIELSLQRMHLRPFRFTAFRGAHILSTAALYYRLTRDRAFLRAETPALSSSSNASPSAGSRPARHAAASSRRRSRPTSRITASTASLARSRRSRDCSRSAACGARPATRRTQREHARSRSGSTRRSVPRSPAARSGSATDRCSSPTSCRRSRSAA